MSMPTVEIGKKIVEDYINGPDSSFFDSNTLSIVDLREIPYTYSKLCETMQQEEGVLDSRYSVISQARYNAKSFGDGEYEQIDIKSYLEECGKSDTELGKVLRSAVKSDASQVVFTHNHPSGILKPSNADLVTTQALEHTLFFAGIKMLDHIIVADGKCMSILPYLKGSGMNAKINREIKKNNRR